MMFDPVFSDLLPVSLKYLLIVQRLGGQLHMLSLVWIAREVFFFLGECM
ncbi:unnamed protein product [Staurois parvus]|uniref:Uncharacterized protein n=1 Tax=Staurois parvus TaxID=386267 RepID=A0ABN9HHU2_9NEOB|nr:unnamed protein product [Staurois parvus]